MEVEGQFPPCAWDDILRTKSLGDHGPKAVSIRISLICLAFHREVESHSKSLLFGLRLGLRNLIIIHYTGKTEGRK